MKDYTKQIRPSGKWKKIEFDAWIVSKTPYEELKKDASDGEFMNCGEARMESKALLVQVFRRVYVFDAAV